jgi:citronellol/citronellal dehydrogenase
MIHIYISCIIEIFWKSEIFWKERCRRMTSRTLAGRTLLISGGSRGIGLAIGVRAARDGANVALLAKTADPHPRLPGTIYTAAREIEAAGGAGLPIVGDVRDDACVAEAVARAAECFGGIDIVVNNASAINLSATPGLAMKQYDLMQDINCRGTFLLTKTALPYLLKSPNPHVLTLSPPLSLKPHWVGAHVGYTIAKYGMSLTTLGFAHEFATCGVAVNSLWPRTLIDTAAVRNLLGDAASRSRTPEIMSDAAHAILTRPSRECTGNFFVDETVLRESGVTDFTRYLAPGASAETLLADSYLD